MKFQFKKQDWQLLGQIALEASRAVYYEDEQLQGLCASIVWEFYTDNPEAFGRPRTRTRKMRPSVAFGILYHIRAEKLRNDPLWDTNLLDFRNRFEQFIFPKGGLKLK